MSRGRKRDKTYTSTHGGDAASSKVMLRTQGLSQYLRNAGEKFEDGRTVQ